MAPVIAELRGFQLALEGGGVVAPGILQRDRETAKPTRSVTRRCSGSRSAIFPCPADLGANERVGAGIVNATALAVPAPP